MKGTLLFLGTGASTGIPVIGCSCEVCHSQEAKNRRLRPSALIQINKKNLLIDVGPDFREQALQHHIDRIDGLLLTHAHYDHIGGIDDLRVLYFMQKKPIDCLVSKETFHQIQVRYEHLFKKASPHGSLSAQLDFTVIEEEAGMVEFLGVPIGFFSFFQGLTKITGYRIGDLAYLTDIRDFSDNIFTSLTGVKTLVISALREEPSPVHFSIDEAIEFAATVGADSVYITHIAHETEHQEVSGKLPENVHLAYDGLKIEFQME